MDAGLPTEWPHVPLGGRVVTLEPLTVGHAPDLAAVADLENLRHMRTRPREITPEGFAAVIEQQVGRADWRAYAVRVGGRVIGSTSFIDINLLHRFCEIGASWIAPGHQGTAVNPEMKLLMLRHAFEVQRCVRVTLKTDALNTRSQRAIEKLGAVREGVMRKMYLRLDGTPRDSVIYGITDDEWPAVRDRLLARLSAIG